MMDIRKISDDFFTIGNIAILYRKTGNDVYDFNFRNNFECRSIISEIEVPVLLHIGAVEDYAGIEAALEELGMRLLVYEEEHLRCSTIEKWYPVLKEKTPFTKVYDELPSVEELLKDFTFPVFVKGNRQTNRHRKSQCIIDNEDQYNSLREEWKQDKVLSWQKAVVREYVPLQTIDADSFPDMVPISYEFRFFYFEGRCMAYGPYWYMGKQYSLPESELREVLKLTDWAAEKLGVIFLAIDVAKTESGEWIIIEVNDAQESGFVGINPRILWNNTIDGMQNRTWLYIDEVFKEGTVIMGGDPLPGKTIEEMWDIAKNLRSTQELVDAYAGASNKFFWVADDEYDYEQGTEEHKAARAVTNAWEEHMSFLEERLIQSAKAEGLMAEAEEYPHSLVAQIPIMEMYGYRDGNGWWVRKSKD